MDSNNVGAVIFVILLALFIFGIISIEQCGYKLGQVDALTGKIKYEIQEIDNGTTRWKKVKQHSFFEKLDSTDDVEEK